jgi:hypothetical protein
MLTIFLVRQTFWRVTLAILLTGCGAIPAGAGDADQSAATAGNQGKDKDASVDGRLPVLNLAYKGNKAALKIKFPH